MVPFFRQNLLHAFPHRVPATTGRVPAAIPWRAWTSCTTYAFDFYRTTERRQLWTFAGRGTPFTDRCGSVSSSTSSRQPYQQLATGTSHYTWRDDLDPDRHLLWPSVVIQAHPWPPCTHTTIPWHGFPRNIMPPYSRFLATGCYASPCSVPLPLGYRLFPWCTIFNWSAWTLSSTSQRDCPSRPSGLPIQGSHQQDSLLLLNGRGGHLDLSPTLHRSGAYWPLWNLGIATYPSPSWCICCTSLSAGDPITFFWPVHASGPDRDLHWWVTWATHSWSACSHYLGFCDPRQISRAMEGLRMVWRLLGIGSFGPKMVWRSNRHHYGRWGECAPFQLPMDFAMWPEHRCPDLLRLLSCHQHEHRMF